MSFNRPTRPAVHPLGEDDSPRIWSEGRQKPRLALSPLARVSVILARRMARPALLATTRLCDRAAMAMAENTLGPRLARASRAGRALPSRMRIAAGLMATGTLMTSAADFAVPPPAVVPDPELEADLADPPPLIVRRRRRTDDLPAGPDSVQSATVPDPITPPPAPRPAETSDFDGPTLAAIRSLIDDMREPAPVSPRRLAPPPPAPVSGRVLLTRGIPLTPPEPSPPTLGQIFAARVHRLSAGALAATLTLVVLPAGLIGALWLHLTGNDLQTWS